MLILILNIERFLSPSPTPPARGGEIYNESQKGERRLLMNLDSVLSHKYLYLVCHSCESRNPEPLLLDSRLHGNDERKSVKNSYKQYTMGREFL
jgi:hypothetical protein